MKFKVSETVSHNGNDKNNVIWSELSTKFVRNHKTIIFYTRFYMIYVSEKTFSNVVFVVDRL